MHLILNGIVCKHTKYAEKIQIMVVDLTSFVQADNESTVTVYSSNGDIYTCAKSDLSDLEVDESSFKG